MGVLKQTCVVFLLEKYATVVSISNRKAKNDKGISGIRTLLFWPRRVLSLAN